MGAVEGLAAAGRETKTIRLGTLLTLLPLPNFISVLRPPMLVLVVLYWSTMAPRVGGLHIGFFPGMVLDLLQGALLGEHALAEREAAKDRNALLEEKGDDANHSGEKIVEIRKTIAGQ